jgi:hypothetical protein
MQKKTCPVLRISARLQGTSFVRLLLFGHTEFLLGQPGEHPPLFQDPFYFVSRTSTANGGFIDRFSLDDHQLNYLLPKTAHLLKCL